MLQIIVLLDVPFSKDIFNYKELLIIDKAVNSNLYKTQMIIVRQALFILSHKYLISIANKNTMIDSSCMLVIFKAHGNVFSDLREIAF